MITQTILQPAVALMVLNIIVFYWMYATRIPAISKLGLEMDADIPPADLMNKLPANVRWKADNYNHLLEQPTLFYAVVMVLALLGAGSGFNTMLAWTYVGLRVIHTLIQTVWNKIMVRFVVFLSSTVVLTVLIYNAATLVF
jgi:hypothetical protein